MKDLKKIFFLIIFSLLTLFLHNSIRVEVNAEEVNNVEALEQREQERENDFLSQLLLDIPTLTDNPSHIITFVDPSDENVGVQIKIGDDPFEQARSPYTLPALSIGRHDIQFRFIDKYGSTQILDKDIVVIPRPPIINTPIFEEEFLNIRGSGLANSELVLILASNRNITVKETTIDENGNWELQINTEELAEGVYSFTAYTRRYGYASNLAESVTFELGTSERVILNNNGREIFFSFRDLSVSDIPQILSENIDLGLLIGGTFVIGFFISLIISSLVRASSEKRSVQLFEKKIKENNGEKEERELTLKERLSKGNSIEVKEEKEPEKNSTKKETKGKKKKKEKEPKKKTEKILQKVDFLKDYKKFDPDDDDGKEKDNIEVKVTSKK